MLHVRDAMYPAQGQLEPDMTLLEAARIMLAQATDALPVVQAGRMVGLLRLADLLTAPRAARHQPRASESRDPAQLRDLWGRVPVRNIMNDQVIGVTEDTPLMKAAALLINVNRQRLPVLRGDVLVGFVSRADIVRVLFEAGSAESA